MIDRWLATGDVVYGSLLAPGEAIGATDPALVRFAASAPATILEIDYATLGIPVTPGVFTAIDFATAPDGTGYALVTVDDVAHLQRFIVRLDPAAPVTLDFPELGLLGQSGAVRFSVEDELIVVRATDGDVPVLHLPPLVIERMMGAMRIAFPAMVLMACSSPAKPATPPTTRPPDASPVAVSPCVLNGSQLSSYADGAIVLCGTDFSIEGPFTLGEGDSGERCSAIHADGRVVPAATPRLPYPYAESGGQIGKQTFVQICAAEDACTTLTPVLEGDQAVVDAELNPQAQRVVLVISEFDGGPEAVEVWDLVAQTRIAGTEFASIVGVDYLGDTIFVRHARGEDVYGATMLRLVTGKQAKLEVLAEIEYDVLHWAMVGPNHVAVVTGAPLESISIYDVTTGALLGSSSWRSLVGASYEAALVDEDSNLWIHIAGEHDAVAIYVSDWTRVFLGAGVVTPLEGGAPVPYPFRLCPP